VSETDICDFCKRKGEVECLKLPGPKEEEKIRRLSANQTLEKILAVNLAC